ncbi:hypothetical protein [Larkinella harenae]
MEKAGTRFHEKKPFYKRLSDNKTTRLSRAAVAGCQLPIEKRSVPDHLPQKNEEALCFGWIDSVTHERDKRIPNWRYDATGPSSRGGGASNGFRNRQNPLLLRHELPLACIHAFPDGSAAGAGAVG